MHQLKLAFPTRLLKVPLRQAIAQVAQAGLSGIQLDARNELKPRELSETGLRQLLHQLGEQGLQVASVTFPIRRSLSEPEQLDGRVAAIKEALTFAGRLSARVLTVRAGRIPAEPESSQYQLLVDVLNDLARHGNHVGTTLCLTTLGDSVENRAALLDRVDQGFIGTDLDPAGLVANSISLGQLIQRFHSSILHVRLRDALKDMDGSVVETTLGRGEVDWEELLALLDEADFRGWMTAERTAGDDLVGDTLRAIQYIRQVHSGHL